MNPLVSVIVPNYNHATYLQERLDSIFNQSYTNFEVIILDDASQDNSKEIIKNYSNHPKVTKVFYNKKNSGNPFLQWKKGFDLAAGKYIWIAESDDKCSDYFLETLTSVLENNLILSLVYTDSERNAKNWESVKFTSHYNTKVFDGRDFVKEYMLTSPIIVNASAVLFRKEAVKIDVFNLVNNYKTAFDWLFWCDLSMQNKVAYVPKKLNFFRQHQQNTSSKNNYKGLFISEGLQVISHLKKNYNIKLNLIQIKTWASVWAQTSLITNNVKFLFINVVKIVYAISSQILFYYLYYLVKFKFLSLPNIKLQ